MRQRPFSVVAWMAVAVFVASTPALAQSEPPPSAEPPNVTIVPAPPPAAPVPPVVEEESPAPPAAPARGRSKVRLTGSLSGGYAVQRLFAIPSSGFGIGASLGADLGSISIGAQLDVTPTITDGGLHQTTVSFGPVVEGHFDRLRLGGSLRFDTFDAGRATQHADGSDIFSFGIGLGVHLSVDLIRFDEEEHGALFLILMGNVDAFGGAPLYGATGGAGVRL